MDRTVRSLAQVALDEPVAVRRIVFDGVRARCSELGLAEGDRLRVEDRDGEWVRLRRFGGGEVRCPEDLARFVEVDAEDGGETMKRSAAEPQGGYR